MNADPFEILRVHIIGAIMKGMTTHPPSAKPGALANNP